MLNVAFAGFRHGHINGLYEQAMKNPDVSVVAAFEENDEARAAIQKTLGVNFTHDCYDTLLEDPSIDAIMIGDYFGIRGARVIAALKAGKHVMVDKPVCTSLTELDEIERLSKEKNLKVGCMLDLRLADWVETVRGYIKDGNLGEIHSMAFTAQHPLLWGSRAGWYFEEGKHGGSINDIGIHGIDLIPYVTGLTFNKTVAARQWNAFAPLAPNFMDSAQFMAEYSNGAGLIADVSYAAPAKCGFRLPQYWRFTFWGTKGVLECGSNLNPMITVALAESEAPLVLGIEKKPEHVILDYFLADLAGEPMFLDTATVLRSTRDALTIQNAAD